MQCEGKMKKKNLKMLANKNPKTSIISVKELGLKIAKKILDEENSHLVHCNWLFVLTNTDLRWVPTNPTQHEFEKPQIFAQRPSSFTRGISGVLNPLLIPPNRITLFSIFNSPKIK